MMRWIRRSFRRLGWKVLLLNGKLYEPRGDDVYCSYFLRLSTYRGIAYSGLFGAILAFVIHGVLLLAR